MDVIIFVVIAFVGYKASGIDFPTLYFYISLASELTTALRRYATNDKTAKR